MPDLVANLSTAFDLLLVILGFGAIVFVHELGHFLAARWAKIRVLAFAIGFGPAIVSYRKGLGFRRGSSEREVRWTPELGARGISPTEYRFNALPFGGYVKMLGQDDIDATATSDAKDSYQNAPVGKRMVVISAGVIMNIVTAAILFIAVFMVGLKTEPPIIGDVIPGEPASMATPTGAPGSTTPTGLMPGDRLLTINGRPANTFNDLLLATGMSGPNDTVEVTLLRTPSVGEPQTLSYSIKPEISRQTGLFDVGVLPSRSAQVFPVARESERAQFAAAVERVGLAGLEPGSTLIRVNDQRDPKGPSTIRQVAASLETAQPIELEFRTPTGATQTFALDPLPGLLKDLAKVAANEAVAIEHVLGLAPVMTVAEVDEDQPGYAKGLRTGDIFARVGGLEFPRLDQGMREIRANESNTVNIVVLRETSEGTLERIDLGRVRVDKGGTVGFLPGTTARDSTLLARAPESLMESAGGTYTPAAAALSIVPGSRITKVDGVAVSSLGDLAVLVRERAQRSSNGAMEPFSITITDPSGTEATLTMAPTATETERARQLVWQPPLGPGLFMPTEFKLKADGPLGAVKMGLSETRRVMLMTYMTFVRLFQGTVKVEHLKGPVGIAHMGTLLADRGVVWLLFFLALVSVNLAVINFLPMPIVDGGQMVFLLFEWARGKPVPVQIQNVITIAGLVCIAAMFLLVTFNDVRNLLGL